MLCLRLGSRYADNLSAGLAHFFNRLGAVAWVDVDRAHGVGEGSYFKALPQGIQHSVFDTIVGGESAYPNLFDFLIAQGLREIRPIKTRVTVGVFIYSF